MRKKFVGTPPRFRRRSGDTEAGGLANSPYYWWWKFLKRNERYIQCCEAGGSGPMERIYQDFGDVRSDDFKKWWRERGEDLFCEPPVPVSMHEITDPAEIAKYDPRSYLVVVAPLSLTKRYLQRRFSELLRKRHTRRRGGNQFASSLARYPLASKPVVKSLRTTLLVYDLWKAHRHGWTLAQIGVAARIDKTIKIDPNEKDKLPSGDKINLAILVSRYLKHARAYIDNVGKGVFPKK